MVHRIWLAAVLAGLLVVATAGSAFATIHPLVESAECAQANGLVNRPMGPNDVADPPGQTPGVTPGNGNNVFRALQQTWTDFPAIPSSNPALFGHKLDGKCGKVGQP